MQGFFPLIIFISMMSLLVMRFYGWRKHSRDQRAQLIVLALLSLLLIAPSNSLAANTNVKRQNSIYAPASTAPSIRSHSNTQATTTTPNTEKPTAANLAENPPTSADGVQFSADWDAYYTSFSLDIPLCDSPEPDGGRLHEAEVYRQLFRDSLRPRLLMLEASVYPLPVLGTWYKRHYPEQYQKFDIAKVGESQLNVIDGVTAGFQEPWAISAFVGSSMAFRSRAEKDKRSRNRGYMGYLISAGNQHIRNNVMINDDWWEFEWKLKGERNADDQELSWSFRIGMKTHGNPDIRDVVYIGIRRRDIDYDAPWLRLLNNANVEFLTEIARDNTKLMRQEFTVGRNLPWKRYRLALSLDVGVIYESPSKYQGALRDPTADTLTVVFRPNIKF